MSIRGCHSIWFIDSSQFVLFVQMQKNVQIRLKITDLRPNHYDQPTKGLKYRPPLRMFRAMEAAVMRTQRAMAIKSVPLNGRAEYQVRFRFFPKPLSSMAFAMRSILSMLEIISGNSIMTAFFSLSIFDHPCKELMALGARIAGRKK